MLVMVTVELRPSQILNVLGGLECTAATSIRVMLVRVALDFGTESTETRIT